MKFREQIPEEIFINPNADKFVTVLDGANDYKQSVIHKAHRFYRSVLHTDTKFLIKRVEDYGFPTIPADFPKDVLDALLLNAEDINAMRGSKEGLRLWLWCLTFGNINVDDSLFFPKDQFIQPDDVVNNGFIDKFNPNFPIPPSQELFLFDDITQFGTSILNVTIDTKYWNHPTIPTYINTHIRDYLTFVTGTNFINVTFNPGVYTTYGFPYQYFVLP